MTTRNYRLIFLIVFFGIGTTGVARRAITQDLVVPSADYVAPMVVRTFTSVAESKNTATQSSHASSQGYWLAAAALALETDHPLFTPAFRRQLIETGRGEIEEMIKGQNQVIGGGPGFGLDYAYDAFRDGSENPPFTADTFNSGMASWGALRFLTVIAQQTDSRPEWWPEVLSQVAKWVEYWEPYYTEWEENGETLGFWWYTDREVDAIAVHNVSALIAMATDLLSELEPESETAQRPGKMAEAYFRFFRARLRIDDAGCYVWNYSDDGYPEEKRRPEDAGHALIDYQMIAHLARRDFFSSEDIDRFRRTLTENLWTGDPVAPAANVAGEGTADESKARASFLAFAVGASLADDPTELREKAQLVFENTYLKSLGIKKETGRVDGPRLLGLAHLIHSLSEEKRLVLEDDFSDAEAFAKNWIPYGFLASGITDSNKNGTPAAGAKARPEWWRIEEGRLIGTRFPEEGHPAGIKRRFDPVEGAVRMSFRFRIPANGKIGFALQGDNPVVEKQFHVAGGTIFGDRVVAFDNDVAVPKDSPEAEEMARKGQWNRKFLWAKVVRHSIEPGHWHDAVIEVRGRTLTIHLNGEQVLEYETLAGDVPKLSLTLSPDAHGDYTAPVETEFDDVRVERIPIN